MTDADDRLARKASTRYWESEVSVNSLAEELGISKGRLYNLLRPLPVEGICPRCGSSPPTHPNRTARDRGEVNCLYCGWEGPVSKLAKAREGEGDSPPSTPPAPRVHAPGADGQMGMPALLSGLLIGLAAGILVGRTLGR